MRTRSTPSPFGNKALIRLGINDMTITELFENKFPYQVPQLFGRLTNCGREKYMNKERFSDHFPISLTIQEK